MKTIFKSFFLVAVLALVMTGCQKETDNINVSLKSSVTPVLYPNWQSGNAEVECGQVGGCGFAYKVDDWNQSNGMNGTYTHADGNVITISNSNGKTFDWSSEWPVCKVIVKAGTGAFIYSYPVGTKSDAGLVAPEGKDISHVTFCFSNPEEECEWVGHTAFGGNLAGAGSAWWFYYDSSIEGPQAIYAGQMLVEGASVNIDENGLLTIVLGENLRLQAAIPVEKTNKKGVTYWDPNNEQVKVQGYSVLPMSRPAAGGFTLYKGRDLEIDLTKGGTLNVMPYYVIHLDVELKVCPEPEM